MNAPIGVISTRSDLPVFDDDRVDPAPLPKHELLASLYPETVQLLAAAWGPDWESYL
jgi:hypothetical protein